MKTLEALKRLAVKLTPCGTESAAVGDTIDEVIDYIASHCNVNCNKLCIKDSDGAFYDITVSTNGVLVVTPKVKVATPTFTPATGATFEESQSVEIACATAGATIYYTTDGSTPTKESSVYSEAITVSATTTIKAFADKDGCTDSDVATATYTKSE